MGCGPVARTQGTAEQQIGLSILHHLSLSITDMNPVSAFLTTSPQKGADFPLFSVFPLFAFPKDRVFCVIVAVWMGLCHRSKALSQSGCCKTQEDWNTSSFKH